MALRRRVSPTARIPTPSTPSAAGIDRPLKPVTGSFPFNVVVEVETCW
jgi:hypothetical protein